MPHADAVCKGDGETCLPHLIDDWQRGQLKRIYDWTEYPAAPIATPRKDLLDPADYLVFNPIQTTRGCPLNCTFCSVTAFNGRRYRHRPIDHVVREMKQIEEKYVLVVDDNLFGTRKDHMARSKELFRAIIDAKLGKRWICQATANMADDEEMLELAAKSG